MRLSISFRLGLAFAALWLVATSVILGVVWWQTSGYLDRSVDRLIATDVQGLSDLYRSDGLGGLVDTINARVLRRAQPDALYAVIDPQGRRLVGNLDAEGAARMARGWSTRSFSRAGTTATARFFATVVPEGFGIVVGRDITDSSELRSNLVEAIATGAVLALLGAVLTSLAFNWLLRTRLERVTRTARGIMAGDLSARVAVDGSGDAFDGLAGTLNGMLDRIQSLMEGLRQVSNDIAHDLRTPLTVLRGRLERLAAAPAETGGQAELQAALAQTDEILRIFEALLRISAIDTRPHRDAFVAVDLADVVRNIAEIYEPLAEEAGRRLQIDTPVSLAIRGDRQLLAQALANMVDNALKHGEGPVAIALAADDDGLRLSVSDRGAGVPAAERRKVLERFYRGDRARSTPGSGLGLAMVDAVARLHEGKVELSDNAPGLIVTLDMPRTAQRSPSGE